MTNTLTVIYGDTKIEVPANTELTALKAAMAENFPELKQSEVVQVENTIVFKPKAGTKGAGNMENLVVIYGDTRIEVPAGTEINSLKAAMAENFPELKQAEVTQEGNTIKFAPKAGTKGVEDMTNLTVIYGDTRIEVPANTDLNSLKVAMAENFPELKSAEVTQDGNTIRFAPKAGTKGSDDTITVIYGDTRIQVPANTELQSLKAAMAENFPELKSAEVTQEGSIIRFTPKAGTKGSDDTLTVIYGDTRITVPAGTELQSLKAAMAENFPELKSAEVTQEGNTIRFAPKAGTKGA